MLCGCSSVKTTADITLTSHSDKTEPSATLEIPSSEESTVSFDEFSKESVFLPNISHDSADLSAHFKKTDYGRCSGFELLADNYYALLHEYQDGRGITAKDVIINIESGEMSDIEYPDNFPDWSIGSGSSVVLQGRYKYEWKSYTGEFGDGTMHDMKLTRIDRISGTAEVVDEAKLDTPFVYLCRINDSQFLS